MKKLVLIIIAFGVYGMLSAQQLPVYSQYMFNRMLINPGVTGSEPDLPLQLVVRQQWVGFENAPSTQMINGHYCFTQYNMGVGGILFVDRFGHEQKIGINLNYSYFLPVFDEAKLSFGLSFQLFQYRLDYSELVALDTEDPNIYGSDESKIVPESDFGVYLYHEDYFAGISANQMIGLPIKIAGEEIHMGRLVRQFNIMGGYKFELDPEFDLEPSALIKTTFKAPSQLDLNVKCIYLDNYWLGLSYRTCNDIVTILGLTYKEFDFGIAADFATSEIASYQHGSYELMVKYRIPMQAKSLGERKY